MMRYILVIIFLCACSAPIRPHIELIDGQYVHFMDIDDDPDSPCPKDVLACYQYKDNQDYIWLSRVASEDQKRHEISHKRGMLHTEWVRSGREWCSTVIRPGDGYEVGQTICSRGKSYSVM